VLDVFHFLEDLLFGLKYVVELFLVPELKLVFYEFDILLEFVHYQMGGGGIISPPVRDALLKVRML